MKRLGNSELEEIAIALRDRERKLRKQWELAGLGADQALERIKTLHSAAKKLGLEVSR